MSASWWRWTPGRRMRQWNEQVSRLQSLDDVSWVRLEQLTRFSIMHLLRDMRDMDVFDEARETEVWRTFEKAAGLRDLTALLHELVAGGSEAMQRKKSSDMLKHSAKDYIDRHLGRDFALRMRPIILASATAISACCSSSSSARRLWNM